MSTAPEMPRKRKPQPVPRLPGIRELGVNVEELGELVAERLKLTFKPDNWQAALIHKIAQGYDSIFTQVQVMAKA